MFSCVDFEIICRNCLSLFLFGNNIHIKFLQKGDVEMTDFATSKTKLNLARAFAGECQDGARYQFLAKQALNEGYYYMQMIFKTHAKNEMAHAKRFFDLLNEYSESKLKNIARKE